MAKFYGKIGYAESVETRPGVWEDVIRERTYSGDVLRNARRLSEGENLNREIAVNNSLSIVADPYLYDHFHNIRYVNWSGANWVVQECEVLYPRLNLRLGEVYNGPTAETP